MSYLSRCKKRIISVSLLIAFFAAGIFAPLGIAENIKLDESQRNVIAMLNYITVLTQDIYTSKNSRLYLEQVYSSLPNNMYPNSVDSRTQSQLDALLDIMERYRMVNVKRDRLQYIYDQQKAQAIRSAIPNPLGVLSAVQSFRPSKIAATIVYMALDSISNQMSYASETELEYLNESWALDDDEARVIHDSTKGAFNYMVEMVNEHHIPGDVVLTPETVDEFVKWKNEDNLVSRIRFMESNEKTYQSYGGYWLCLAESYYNNGDFAKCLDAISTYESINARIFRKDYELARILPLVISAADEVLEGKMYVNEVSRFTKMLLDNTKNTDWEYRYFAAQSYVNLCARTNDKSFLQNAYEIILDNVNNLSGEQRSMNETYMKSIEEIKKEIVPENEIDKKESIIQKASGLFKKKKKTEVEEYLNAKEATRKTELPPVSDALQLNCDFLYALAEEMNISETDKNEIDGILHKNGTPVFLNQPLDKKYWFSVVPEEIIVDENTVEFGGNVIILPAVYVTDKANIVVKIHEKESGNDIELTDWKIDKVEREKEHDAQSFHAIYTSDNAKKYSWAPDAEINIFVDPREGTDLDEYHFKFVTHGTKNEWYDYLKVWEGHKNNWYDYGKVWENSVVFEQVE